MSQPPPYNRQASFANLQALNPSGQPPGNLMDAEYAAIKTTLDATLANLKFLQNDDTTVLNGSIGPAQLSSQLLLGFTAPSVWKTATGYTASPTSTVLQSSSLYICLVSHTSGVFATDLANGKWLLVLNLAAIPTVTASQVGVTSDGGLVTSDVQTSLNALDAGKAATSHTHTASQISDSTVVGRQMLTAANTAAQQALLGLGSLAFLSTVPATTAIPGQLAFTGSLTATVAASNNDLVPTGWAISAVARLNSASNFTITGFGATSDGDIKFVQNISIFSMTLLAFSTSSAAVNRIALPRPLVLGASQAILMQYDGTAAVWKILSPIVSQPARGSARNLRLGNVANYLGDAAPSAPNNQAYIIAEEIVLEDSQGTAWQVTASLTVDGTTTGANGMDVGVLGASAWYSMWIIGNPITNTVAGLISTSSTGPTLPGGYGFKVRVGWMRTDGSSHFLKILQYGKRARYSGTFPTITSGNSGGADFSVANFIPSTAPVIALFPFGSLPTGTVITASPTATASPGSPLQSANATGSTQAANSGVTELHLEAATVHYSSTAGAGPGIACYGWEDTI